MDGKWTYGKIVHLHVPNIAESSAMVRAHVEELATKNGATKNILADILLVVGEALANAVEHSKSNEPIEVKAEIDEENIVIDIWDRGVGFAVEIHKEKEPDIYSERGRGMMLMATLSDSCTIASAPGWGTRVTIIRRIEDATNL